MKCDAEQVIAKTNSVQMRLHGQKLLVGMGQAKARVNPLSKDPADSDPQIAQDEGRGNVRKSDAPRLPAPERVGSAGVASRPGNALGQRRHRCCEGYCGSPVETPVRHQQGCQNPGEEYSGNCERCQPRFSGA